MCGIIGIVSKSGRFDLSDIKASLNTMTSRGNDDEGIWADGNLLIGHRRLSIVGLRNGHQPMVSEDGNIVVVCNGEFYGYKNIKHELSGEYEFKTDSDSEILIPLYKKYGIKGMMSKLRGEFGFILYDKENDTLYAVRDRFGIKPLCWWSDSKGNLIVASKAKAILTCGISPQWDNLSLSQALTFQYQPIDRTFFKGIRQVKPGYVLEYRIGNPIRHFRYWDIEYPRHTSEYLDEDGDSIIKQLHDITYEAIRIRTETEVPICCHLSGGLDSSIIAGVMGVEMSKPIDCFSIVFPDVDETYNEEIIARQTVKRIGGNFHAIEITQSEILDHLDDAVYHSEGLAVNGHLSCKYLMNKRIHEAGFKVALTGEGSDECFGGYSHLRHDLYSSLSAHDRKKLQLNLYSLCKAVKGTELAEGKTLDCSIMEKSLGFIPSFLRAKAGIGFKIHQLLTEDFKMNMNSQEVLYRHIESMEEVDRLRKSHPINISSYLWIKSALCNYILSTLGDGCEMAWQVEGRLPFLDHQLFEYSSRIPVDLKIMDFVMEKYCLREAMHNYISDEVYKRHKNAFQAPPLTLFFSKEINERINGMLLSGSLQKLGFIDMKKLQNLLNFLPSSDRNTQTVYEPVIMLLLTMTKLSERFGL